jgi:methionyl-tRNA formyltransferase
MKKLKVIFFGTSDRSTPILEALKINFDLVLCITKKDKKVGRKHVLKETEVKKWAKLNNTDFIGINSLKNEDLELVIKKIEELKPDYGVVADFGFIIPKKVIDLMNGQIINVHFSLLPKYRGASPVQHAILNGDKITGITYYLLDEKMDTGNIIHQIEYIIDTEATSGQIYEILFKIASEKLPDVIKKLHSNELKPIPQDNNKATYTFSPSHPKSTYIFKEDARIDWNQNPNKIERAIRAYNPWPIAWTTLQDMENSNTLSEKIPLKDHVDRNLKIKIYNSHVEDGKLKVGELQVEGKNKLKWDEFRNGYVKRMK